MKIISIAVGTILLTTSLILSYLSSNSAKDMIENKNKIMTNYIFKAKENLQQNNTKDALKFAKLAIQTDPKSKDGFKIYEEIMQHIYNIPKEVDTSEQNQHQESTEEEVDMGC